MADTPSVDDTPDGAALAVEAACMEQLERAWRSWRPGRETPRWDALLPGRGEPCGPDRAFHLVQLDIECRVKAGLPALLADAYFLHPRPGQPDAHLDDARQVELIRWEYQLRWKNGQRARRQDYLSAFPRHAAALADLRPRWACPACRRPATAEDEDAPSWRCPRCDRAFAPTEVFPARPPQPGTEAEALPSLRDVGTVPAEALPPRPRLKDAAHSTAGLDAREYELLDQLGAGGMGEVYRGRDPGLGRDLAVKVMRPELRGDPEAEARFLREARVTGALEHPGIVPVHNLGRLPDGRPYFTMKLVRGRTLESLLADRSQARPEQFLGHFEKICQAVAYAHSKRVIHRDLKPANVMVGRFGEVQVMDWGLAKVVAGRGGPSPEDAASVPGTSPPEKRVEDGSTIIGAGPGETSGDTAIPAAGQGDLSRAGRAMGTPAFMPPEQARGLLHLVDERADVFSLGAILCVILTGRPPYQSSQWQDVLAQARRGDLAEALGRLDGCGADAELVTLGRECLAANPDGRPRDAEVVAQRVAAYQAGVQERLRQAELERTQARVQELERRKRRRLAGSLVAVLVAGLSVGLLAVGTERNRTAAALAEAEGNLKLARQAIDECFNAASKDPLFQQPRMEKARKLLLEKTLPFYRHFGAARPHDPSVRGEEAKQWARVAFIEQELGQAGRARQAHEQARAMQQRLVQAHPRASAYQSDLATTHNDLAVLLSRQSRYEEALAESRRARDLQQALAKANPAVPGYRYELARTHNVLAVQLAALGRPAEAEEEYRRACDLGGELVEAHPGVLDYQNELARPHLNLGALLEGQGRREEALREYQRARDIRVRLAQARPDVPEYQNLLARVHAALGSLLGNLGRGEEALKDLWRARELQLPLARTHPDLPLYQEELARIDFNLGLLLSRLGKPDESLKVQLQARDHWLELVKAFPGRPEYRKQLSDARTSLGALLYNLDRFEEARREYQHARELLAPLVKAHPDDADYAVSLARSCLNQGQVLNRLGRPRDSLPALDEGITLLLRLRGRRAGDPQVHSLLVFGLPQRADALLRLGRTGEADAAWESLLNLGSPEERVSLRVRRADVRGRAGDYRRSADEADELGREPSLTPAQLYDLACIQALNAASAGRDASRPLAERQKRAEGYAQRAVALLRRAAAARHFHDPARLAGMAGDADLAPLRDRDDFRALVRDLRPGAHPGEAKTPNR